MTRPYALHETDDLVFITSPALDAFEGLCHAFSTRLGGVSTGPLKSCNLGMAPGEKASNVVENRRRLFKALRLPNGPVTTVNQVHSADVVVLRPPVERGATGEEADALVTGCVEVPMAVFHADCMPLVVFDPRTKSCGLAHAGREGLRLGVARALVESMVSEMGSSPDDLQAAVGPGIRVCCYEVGQEIVEQWKGTTAWANERLFRFSSGRTYLDLSQALVGQLIDGGLLEGNIHDTGLCTTCRTDLFFSYRAEGPGTGRLMTLAVLLPTIS